MPQWWRRDRLLVGLDTQIPRMPRDPIPDLVAYLDAWDIGLYARASGFLDWLLPERYGCPPEPTLTALITKYSHGLWWYVWRHGTPHAWLGPHVPVHHLGADGPPCWWLLADRSVRAPCGHRILDSPLRPQAPWVCLTCGATALLPLHSSPWDS